MNSFDARRWALPAAVVAPIVVASSQIPFPGDIDKTNFDQQLLLVVVAIAATGHRLAAVVSPLV